jgi:hypothetical protein
VKDTFFKQEFLLSSGVIIISTLLLSSLALAVSDPTVIEEVTKYPFGDTHISYTIINPADSSIGDIVGFVVEVDYKWSLYSNTTNGWLAQGLTGAPLNAATWDSTMAANNISVIYELTWRQFYGGINYPFGSANGVGYFVSYDDIAADTFKFDWSSSSAPYHLPVLAGETLGGFYTDLDQTASHYVLAYIDDAQNNTFGYDNIDKRLRSFQGETLPEPITLSLFGLGGLALLRRRRA